MKRQRRWVGAEQLAHDSGLLGLECGKRGVEIEDAVNRYEASHLVGIDAVTPQDAVVHGE